MKCYAGVGLCTAGTVAALLELPTVEGVVLGDYFCQNRMFEHGMFDIPQLGGLLKAAGRQVILQTPMYLTPERLRQWVQLIGCLRGAERVDAVLLQDIGLMHTLRQEHPDVALCWSQMGKGRGAQLNAPFVEFLRQAGVRAIELDNAARAGGVAALGLEVWQVYGSLSYQTFWRECYTCHQLDLPVVHCGHACRGALSLVSDGLELSINGHILEEQLVYKPEAAQPWPFAQRHGIYAKDIESLKGVVRI